MVFTPIIHRRNTTKANKFILQINLFFFFFLQFENKVAKPLFVFLKYCEKRHIALEAFFSTLFSLFYLCPHITVLFPSYSSRPNAHKKTKPLLAISFNFFPF